MSRLFVFLLFVASVYSYDFLSGPVEMVCSNERCLFGDEVVEAPNNTITRLGNLTINRIANTITTDTTLDKVFISVFAAMSVILGVIAVDQIPE